MFPNASAKLKGERQGFVGEAMLDVKDVSTLSLRRPVDRGFVVAWDLQRDILARWVTVVGRGQGRAGQRGLGTRRSPAAITACSCACRGSLCLWQSGVPT